MLRAMPELSGPGVWVRSGRSSDRRGFSEWVAALTRLSCLGFSHGGGLIVRSDEREEQSGKKDMSAEWTIFHSDVIQ